MTLSVTVALTFLVFAIVAIKAEDQDLDLAVTLGPESVSDAPAAAEPKNVSDAPATAATVIPQPSRDLLAPAKPVNLSDPLIVQIPNGFLRGRTIALYDIWESIPFAEPPVGPLRFEAPQPYRRNWTDVFNATALPPFCMQWYRDRGVNKLQGVEDCLMLNVYRPKDANTTKFPVMVFVHGGHFMTGGSIMFEPEQFMASRRAILVKIAFRLGPLGFLSTQDEALPGNYGLKDQQLALQWVKENIARFGGDPEKIMLYGYSSGGAATHLHMLQPSLQNVVKVVVSTSGVALNPWAIQTNARDNALRLATLVNCTDTQNTTALKVCLQAARPEDIVRNVQAFLNIGYNPLVPFGPVVEPASVPNAFLTRQPRDIIKSGQFSNLPWLVSYTSENGGFNAAELMRISSRTGIEFIYDLNVRWLELAPQNLFLSSISTENPQDCARQLKETYLGNANFSKETYQNVQAMYTDVLFRNGALEAMSLHSRYSKAPVYGYVYSNPPEYNIGYDLSLRKNIPFGTNHLDDVTLILDTPQRSTPRRDEVVISQKLVKMLIDFAETGQLTYDNCPFEDNTGKGSPELSLLSITRDKCETIRQNFDIK